MKLHLSTLLCVAVLGAMSVQADSLTYSAGTTKYNIGTGGGSSTLTNPTVGESGVVIGDGVTVGTYNNHDLIVDGIGSVSTSQTNNLTIQRTEKVLFWEVPVTGDLTINGNGQVAVGGKSSDNKSYSSLTAENIIVKGDGSVVNLKASVVKANTLTVNSGKVEIHTGSSDFSQGNSFIGNIADSAPKQAQIYNGITVNGGSLVMGSKSGAYVTSLKHYTTGFGSDGLFSDSSCTVSQSGGTMAVYGDSIAQGGFTINQTGNAAAKMYFSDNLALMGNATITQDNTNADTKLVLGRLTDDEKAVTVTDFTVTLKQSGAGSIQLASGTDFSKSANVNITQSGAGYIQIGGGIDKAEVGVNNIEASRLGFTSTNTTYNIDQTGSGTILLSSGASITAGKISVSGLFQNDGSLDCSSIDVNGGKFVNNGTVTSKTTVNVKDGGEVSWENAQGGQSVANLNINVDETSSLTTTHLVVGKGMNINTNGKVIATEGITVDGGLVKGTGEVCKLTLQSGSLIVGNSPGVQSYTGNLELLDGEVTFSLADIDNLQMATEQNFGWESGAYSTIDMNNHNLAYDGSTINIALGSDAVESALTLQTGALCELTLTLIQNIGNVDSLTAEVLAKMAANTNFIITSEDEGLSDEYKALAGSDLSNKVASVTYSVSNGNLVLNATMIPEPTTATLSLLALAALAARRRRK